MRPEPARHEAGVCCRSRHAFSSLRHVPESWAPAVGVQSGTGTDLATTRHLQTKPAIGGHANSKQADRRKPCRTAENLFGQFAKFKLAFRPSQHKSLTFRFQKTLQQQHSTGHFKLDPVRTYMHHTLRCHTAKTHRHLTPEEDAARHRTHSNNKQCCTSKLGAFWSSLEMPGTPLDKTSVHTASEGGLLLKMLCTTNRAVSGKQLPC